MPIYEQNLPPKLEVEPVTNDNRTFLKTTAAMSLTAAAILAITPSHASAAVDISHKLKIAGDLRMFTQRMALSAAFVMLDVEKDHYLEVLAEEYHEFEADINSLRNGDADFAMKPETNKLVLEAINTVEFGWKVLGPSLKKIIDTNAITDAEFTKIEKVNTQVMTLADSLVHRIMFEYKDEIPQDLASQIAVVVSQRTLSQKMIKEAILVALEFEADAHHEMLLGSTQLFGFGFDKLAGEMLHNEHMLPPVTGELANQLQAATQYWTKLKPLLEQLDTSHEMSSADAVELANEADDLLAVFNSMFDLLIKDAEKV